jgi:hypothetical protein
VGRPVEHTTRWGKGAESESERKKRLLREKAKVFGAQCREEVRREVQKQHLNRRENATRAPAASQPALDYSEVEVTNDHITTFEDAPPEVVIASNSDP